MSKKKQVLLALAREVIALYSDQSPESSSGQALPRTQSGVVPPIEIPQTEGQVQTARKLTTGKTFDGRRFVPSLLLQGQWLEQAGFPVGTRVVVQSLPRTRSGVQEGRIVLLGSMQK